MALRYPQLVGFDPAWDWTINFRLPMHAPMPRSPQLIEPAESPGILTGWEEALFHELTFETWRIPTQDVAGAPGITGWYGEEGVAAFVVQARRKKPFRLILDRDVPGTYRTVQLITLEEDREPLKVQMFRARWHVRAVDGGMIEV